MEKTKILFVCLGNICRSPLAHAVFEHMVKKQGLEDKFEIESCGIGSWHIGSLPDKRMREEAEKHGIQMNHLGRTLQVMDFEYYDLILPMDLSNKNDLLAKARPEYAEKIKLFRTFDPKAKEKDPEVPDPYYGGAEGFKQVYQMVERTCDYLLKYLS